MNALAALENRAGRPELRARYFGSRANVQDRSRGRYTFSAGPNGGDSPRGDPSFALLLAAAISPLQAEIQSLRLLLRGHARPRQILSLREAAKLLGIDRNRTLKVLIASGQMRTVTINGRPKVSLLEVERLSREGFDSSPKAKPVARRRRGQTAAGVARVGIRSIKL